MSIRKLFGLTTEEINIKNHEGTLLKPWPNITPKEFQDLLEARRLMAGEPLQKGFYMYECIGWLGKIFGHKFNTIDYHYNNCQRCGMPKGGWINKK